MTNPPLSVLCSLVLLILWAPLFMRLTNILIKALSTMVPSKLSSLVASSALNQFSSLHLALPFLFSLVYGFMVKFRTSLRYAIFYSPVFLVFSDWVLSVQVLYCPVEKCFFFFSCTNHSFFKQGLDLDVVHVASRWMFPCIFNESTFDFTLNCLDEYLTVQSLFLHAYPLWAYWVAISASLFFFWCPFMRHCWCFFPFLPTFFGQKTKRPQKVEVGTGTRDVSMDEWLEVRGFMLYHQLCNYIWFVFIWVCVVLSSIYSPKLYPMAILFSFISPFWAGFLFLATLFCVWSNRSHVASFWK